jgi:hypothetical protein
MTTSRIDVEQKMKGVKDQRWGVNDFPLNRDTVDQVAKRMMKIAKENHALRGKALRAILTSEGESGNNHSVAEVWVSDSSKAGITEDELKKQLNKIIDEKIASASGGEWSITTFQLTGVV